MEWQPIETAPKDGTWLLLLSDGETRRYYREAKWRLDVFGKEWCWGGDGWTYANWGQPTHWMPLPNPPSPE